MNNTDVYHSENGTYEVIAECANASGDIRFYSNNFNGSIDNVSVREVTEADFDFDRNSTGTRVNEDYLIEDVPYNLATYSEDFSTAWSFDDCTATNNSAISPDGTLTAALFKGNTNNSAHSMNKSPSPSQSVTGTISLFAKAKELKHIQIVMANTAHQYVNFDVSNGTIGTIGSDFTNVKIESAGNGWYRLSATSLNRFNGIYINLVSGLTAPWLESWSMTNNTDGLYIWGVQLVKGDQPKDYLKTTDRLDIPRIDYTNGEPSILLEPQSSNKLLDSNYQDIKTSGVAGFWLKNPSTSITSNSIVGVYGLQSAATFTYNGGGASEYFYGYQIPVTSGNTYTLSGYVKLGTASNFVIVINSTTSWDSVPNANYVATKDNGHSIWKRFTITFTAPSTNKVNVHLGFHQETGVAAQAEGSVFLDAFQLEELGYATSIIPNFRKYSYS